MSFGAKGLPNVKNYGSPAVSKLSESNPKSSRPNLVPIRVKKESGEYRLDDVAEDIGQAAARAIVIVGQLLVFQAQELEDSGMEIVDGTDILFRFVAKGIRTTP